MSSKNYLSIYAKSFNWAGFFLPKKTYKNCSYLYDFCRVVDNIADDEDEIEIKKIKFQKFVNDFKQKNFENPVIKNMWNIINEFNISLKIIYDLFDGIESDIKQNVKRFGINALAGGGDTVSSIKNVNAEEGFDYISNAGGAFLEWLEGNQSPGVLALRENNLS